MGLKIQRRFIDFLYKISLTKFFMEWILITNPISKNPVIKLLWGWTKEYYTAKDPQIRLDLAKVLFTVHLALGIIMLILDPHAWFVNILVNVYPMLVQSYVGFRCNTVLLKRKNKGGY